MICPKCSTESPNDAKFCMGCGESLQRICENCKTELPGEAQFCFSCGTPVSATKEVQGIDDQLQQYIPKQLLEKMKSAEKSGGIRDERRTVTMLFCDLEGSTAAAEQLDPEEWADIMNGAFEYLIKPVYEYEGVLARLMGDAILAFFGAPIAHEDDPERAVLTGLDILQGIIPYLEHVKQKWHIDVNVRVGINTGLVVVGEMGSDMRVEYTAMGDAINLAARMESSATPGTIQITEYTYKLVNKLFKIDDLGYMTVKGKSHPIKTYRVISRRAERGQTRGVEGLSSPLVGRDEEFDVLHSKIEKHFSGQGQIISIRGEAGLGKSRILSELFNHVKMEGMKIATNYKAKISEVDQVKFSGENFSYQVNTPYSTFTILLTKFFDLGENMSEQDAYARLATYFSLLEGCEDVTPYIANLLNISASPEDIHKIQYLDTPTMQARTLDALKKIFVVLSKHKPVLLVFDDIHWLDSSSFNLLSNLIKLPEKERISIILLFRPRRQDISWQLHETLAREYNHLYTQIEINPLSGDDARFFVFNLLKIEGLSENVRQLILRKTEGNPFFIEEVIRSLIDRRFIEMKDGHWVSTQDIDDISIPDTLVGVLTTRLDKLDDDTKYICQIAAVVGRELQYDVLLSLVEQPDQLNEQLTELIRRELMIEVSREPTRVYSFKHILMQEAAYNSLLMKKRRLVHQQIADLLIETGSANDNEIAHHYYEGRDFEHALPHLVKAANKAASNYASQEAIELYKRAESLVGDTTDIEIIHDLSQGLGQAYLFIGQVENSRQTYESLLSIAEGRDHQECKINAMNQLALLHTIGFGEFDKALEYLENAESLARSCDYKIGLAENYMIKCNLETASAQFAEVEAHLLEATEIGKQLDETRPLLYGRTHVANTMVYTARFQEALDYGLETKEIALERGDKEFLSELLTYPIPVSYMMTGNLEQGLKVVQEGLEIAATIGHHWAQINAHNIIADIFALQGEFTKAWDHINQSVQIAEHFPIPGVMVYCMACKSYLMMETGQDVKAIATSFEQMFEVMETPLGGFLGAKTRAIHGFFELGQGELEKAEHSFLQIIEKPSTLMYLYTPWANIGKAYIAIAKSDYQSAETFHILAQEYVNETGMNYLNPQLELLRGRILTGLEKHTEAMISFQNAERIGLEYSYQPLLIEIKVEMAKNYGLQGDPQKANKYFVDAKDIGKSISLKIKDDDLKESYQVKIEKIFS